MAKRIVRSMRDQVGIINGDVILVALNGNLKINDNQLEAVSGGCGSHRKNEFDLD